MAKMWAIRRRDSESENKSECVPQKLTASQKKNRRRRAAKKKYNKIEEEHKAEKIKNTHTCTDCGYLWISNIETCPNCDAPCGGTGQFYVNKSSAPNGSWQYIFKRRLEINCKLQADGYDLNDVDSTLIDEMVLQELDEDGIGFDKDLDYESENDNFEGDDDNDNQFDDNYHDFDSDFD